MNIGIRIGRLAGVEVALDWSLLIVFALVTVGLAMGVLPAWHPQWNASTHWLTALVAATLLMVSVLVHELSHALVGRAQGVKVRRITLFVFGGVAQLDHEPRRWTAEFWMAIVGPLTSLAIGVACMFAGATLARSEGVDPLDPLAAIAVLSPTATVLLWLGPVNVVLALFNLVPGFPLGGGRVLRALLWGATGDVVRATRWAAGLGRAFGLLLIGIGIAMALGLRLPFFGTGAPSGLWLALIGWFLHNAALLSYRQLLAQRSLEGVPVARLMREDVDSVAPETSVAALIDDYLLASDQRSFPVLEAGRLVGLVSLQDVQKVSPAERAARRVGDIMKPASELLVAEPAQDVADVAGAIAAGRGAAGAALVVPVVSDGRLRGLLRLEDIDKWLALRGSAAAA